MPSNSQKLHCGPKLFFGKALLARAYHYAKAVALMNARKVSFIFILP